MATKEKEKSAATPATNGAETKTTNEIVVGQKTLTREQAAEALRNAEKGEKDSGYLNFEPGKEHKVVFLGWKEIQSLQNPNETVKAAILLTDSGKELINADSAIRSYFERQAIGTARVIVCKGTNKSDKGEYKTFDFYELKVK